MKRVHLGEPGLLQAPTVRFEADFTARLAALSARTRRRRAQREGAGAAWGGGGDDFVGYRPYARGEDLRRLDWNLLARLDRPYVRVLRRAAGERWRIALDASASMGVGPPGKLQRAAEIAAAIASLGVRSGARVELEIARGEGTSAKTPSATADERARPAGGVFEIDRTSRLRELCAFLEGVTAEGSFSLAAFAGRARAGAARTFVIGDLLGVAHAELFALARGELFAIQLLAPEELEPARRGPVEWVDPESGMRLATTVDATTALSYARELERELESWRTAAAAHRVRYGCFSSAAAFEDVLQKIGLA